MTHARFRLPGSNGAFAALALFLVLATAGLVWAKWWPYGGKLGELASTHQWPGTALLSTDTQAPAAPSLQAGWQFLVDYGVAILPALVVALVLGAALEALLPRTWLSKLYTARPGLAGSLCALPTMMCTCCTAPLVTSMRARGVNIRAAVAYWLANPVLNPAVLAFLLLVAPWQWAMTRLAVGALLIAGITAVLRHLFADARPAPASVPAREPPALGRFTLAVRRLVLLVVPEYVIVVFIVGALRGWLFPMTSTAATVSVLALLIAAVLGPLAVLPTGGEIPILLALAAAGASPAVIGTLLITLPALSLPSMVMVGRALTWRVTGMVAGATAVGGLLAGGVLALSG